MSRLQVERRTAYMRLSAQWIDRIYLQDIKTGKIVI